MDSPRPPSAHPEQASPRGSVVRASVWTVGSMGGMSVLRLGSQMLLTYLLAREYFGVIGLMRVFLVFLEMLSDVGIRGSVVYHREGEKREFLDTAWTLQIVRGLVMWALACVLAWPMAAFYDMPILMWLLPVAGFEAVNNGFLSVHIFRSERHLSLRAPVILDWVGILASVATTLLWAWVHPSVWALACGPLVGGVFKTGLSHWLFRATPLHLRWERRYIDALFSFGKWVIGGTLVSFVAQQFHVLYLGKFLPDAILGVYTVAWGFCVQSSKPLTILSNRVIIPHFAQFARRGSAGHAQAVNQALDRFLPACLFLCTTVGLFSPALFGLFYADSFVDGGPMGTLLSGVVWFMVLQHVPRSALLSLGRSREVAGMALINAVFTVAGIIAGFAITGGLELSHQSVSGAVVGNALGNLAGCAYGAWRTQAQGLPVARAMARYSVTFVIFLLAGTFVGARLVDDTHLDPALASVLVTATFALPLAYLVWRSTVRELLVKRRNQRAGAPAR